VYTQTTVQTEADLTAAAAAGDDDAFRRLVRRVYPRLRRWALARTGDPDDADEVVQRTLIQMHRGLGSFEGQSKLSSWLYRILGNVAVDVARSRHAGRQVRVEEGAVAPDVTTIHDDPVRSIHAQRLGAAVRDYLTSLPPRQREVFELIDHEGLSAGDVAEMLEIEPVSVRANLFKARKALRREMLKRYPELMEGYET
jgi:RNA polymerase sigma-70 factor (ECF subfamily)